ncbi:MAG: glucosaminidase domain-containing protein [Bacteroidales bacterium]|nr:glucosaminidase domain-containing protein [Candidatus Cacconaster merdequi]
MKSLVLTFVALLCSYFCFGDNTTRTRYIEKYKDVAVRQMIETGIPASITMAQACLESGDGNSTLAREANNHFGIKCHNTWEGKSFLKDAETKNECFRMYDSAEESFADHSDFLRYSARYAFLFSLDRKDYKGWAYGLKNAGYATDPQYPDKLIRIIEENGLAVLDLLKDTVEMMLPPTPEKANESTMLKPEEGSKLYKISIYREVFQQNGVAYIIANGRDTYRFIAQEYNLFYRELLSFNDLARDEGLSAGTRVYLERKKRSSARYIPKHVVEEGDTMYSISQKYAIQLKCLYQYNCLSKGEEPPVGSVLLLQKPDKK